MFVCVWVRACECVCVYAQSHTHTNTHTHTNNHKRGGGTGHMCQRVPGFELRIRLFGLGLGYSIQGSVGVHTPKSFECRAYGWGNTIRFQGVRLLGSGFML